MKNLLLLPLLLFAFSTNAQTWSQYQKVISDDRDDHDEFGNAVAIDGDYAIVGAKREDHDANDMNDAADAGSCYIYKKEAGSWTQEAKLVAADRESQDWFGHRVDISGTYAIAGAPFEMEPAGAGAAYIFERSGSGTWVQAAKLEAPIRKSSDYFGFSVGISGDWAVCGAYYEDEDENEANEILSAGSAYIFKRNSSLNTWEFHQKIVASDRELDARFGMSVAIDGDQIIVGSEYDDVDLPSNGYQSNAGSAYIYRLNGEVWEEEAHITASDYGSSENFGWTVDVSGDYAIVGAYKNDTDADGLESKPDAGAAYIYERGSGVWAQVKKMVASDRADIDYYGYDVSISGDRAVVGAYRQNRDADGNENFSDAGAAYIIERNTSDEWLEVQKITHTVRATLDQFGYAVDVDGEEIIVGANMEDEDPTDDIATTLPEAGSVFLFNTDPNGVYEEVVDRFSIYPNPAADVLNVKTDGAIIMYEIVDLMGRSIVKERAMRLGKMRVDVSQLNEGVYMIRFNNGKAIPFSVIR